MTHNKVASATVGRPVDEVFDWVTTPAHWPQVSPITLAVETANPARPLQAGDRFVERVRIGAWRGHIDWTVDAVARPNRLCLSGVWSGDTLLSRISGHNDVSLEYTFSAVDGGTRLTRDASCSTGWLPVEDLFGFGRHLEDAWDVTFQTIVSALEAPFMFGPRPDVTADALMHEADPLADDAVASLVSPTGDCSALEQFIASLYRGDPPLAGLPGPVQKFLEATQQRPAWACEPRIQAASQVFLDWGPLTAAAHICSSLPECYTVRRTAKLLNLTHELDSDPQHADRRLWFTVRMCVDILTTGGLDPAGQGMVAVQRLRLLHAMVRLFSQHRMETPNRLAKLSSNGLWDSENGKPISQVELLQTLLTFSHVIVRSLDILDCGLTPYQREAYIHIWNVAGAVLGIREELLPRDAADAARMFDEINAKYAGPSPHAPQLGAKLVSFWSSLLPEHLRDEGVHVMQLTVSTLNPPECVKINGLDNLPAFKPEAVEKIKDFLDREDRLFHDLYADAPLVRRAATMLIALLVRRASEPYQKDSGIWDIPDNLYEQWMKVPPTASA